MGQNKRMEGSRYEQLAARYLEQKGMDVLELNYRCRTGEIDIRKAGQVRRVAAVYLYEHGFPESAACRFDAVGIDGEQITHLKNAF